jgi:hypothetical protein
MPRSARSSGTTARGTTASPDGPGRAGHAGGGGLPQARSSARRPSTPGRSATPG